METSQRDFGNPSDFNFDNEALAAGSEFTESRDEFKLFWRFGWIFPHVVDGLVH